MSESNDTSQKNEVGAMLADGAILVGIACHSGTGAYAVWVSLDANDVTQVGAWKEEQAARQAVKDTAAEYRQTAEAMESAYEQGVKKEAAERMGMERWSAFLDRMEQQSDAPLMPFGPEQLADIAQSIAAATGRPSETETDKAVYLSYTDADGAAPYLQTLDGKEGFELVRTAAPLLGRVATALHLSGKEGDPPIKVVCVTNGPVTPVQAKAIGQAAVNHAMQTGQVPFRR